MHNTRHQPGRKTMLPEEETIKLYAAAYDEDEDESTRDFDDLDDEDDEEEEEELTASVEIVFDEPNTHAEEAELFALPSTPVAPYEPPTHLSLEPTPAPAEPVVSTPKKAPAKKT